MSFIIWKSCHFSLYFALLALAPSCLAIYSARGPKGYSNATCTAVQSSLCTDEGTVDMCLHHVTVNARKECLQNALEAYYGRDMSETCSGLSVILASAKCKGCPWDRLNVTALLESTVEELPLPKRFFHTAKDTCSISNHVFKFSTWGAVDLRTYTLPILAGVLLLLLAGLTKELTGRDVVSKPVWLFGREVPEWIHLGFLWILQIIISLTLSFSEDFFTYCESATTFLTQRQIRAVALAATLAYSFSRCLCLPARSESSNFSEHAQCDKSSISSWYASALSSAEQPKWLFVLSNVFAFVFRLILLGIFLFENRPLPSFRDLCRVYYMDIQFLSLVLGMKLLLFLSIIVYAFGAQQHPARFRARFYALLVILVCCVLLLITKRYLALEASSFLPGLFLPELAYYGLDETHAVMVCLLGIFEPLRTGMPAKCGFLPSSWRRNADENIPGGF